MVLWMVGPIELFLVPASAPQLVEQRPWYVLSCLWEDAYKRTLAANRKGFLSRYLSGPLKEKCIKKCVVVLWVNASVQMFASIYVAEWQVIALSQFNKSLLYLRYLDIIGHTLELL